MEQVQTMEQVIRAGLAFNPLAAANGQGEAFVGNAQTVLREAMKANGWLDMRFLSKHQIEQAGWSVAPDAVPAQITYRAGDKWDNKVLFNASQIIGIPSVEAMLSVARNRLGQGLNGPAETFPEIVPELIDAPAVPGLADEQKRLAEKRQRDDSEDELIRDEDELVVGPARVQDIEEVIGITPVFREKGIGDDATEHVGEQMVDHAAPMLLGKLFKERVPGSGEYSREGESKIAFLDKGNSLVVRDKKADSYQAVMELAKSKGWKEIELTGKPEHLARGWLEAQLLGIKVANYVPNEKDMAALDDRRAEMARAVAESNLPVPAGAKLVTTGQHIGSVVQVANGYVVQASGPGSFVAHKLKDFAPQPLVGDKLDVHYRDGKLVSWLPREASKDLGGGREIGGR